MGELVNPASRYCDDVDVEDMFSNFTLEGMPHSLVTHWSPVMHHNNNYDVSLKSHCVKHYQAEYENILIAEEAEK